MRKIVAGLFISLDGVTEAPDQWHFDYFNDEMGAVVQSAMEASDTMLLGRRTWEEFASYWPTADANDPITGVLNNTPKFVVSTSLSSADAWQNSTVISSLDDVRKLKEQSGADIGMSGSSTLIRSLLKENLLDELSLLVHPVAVGTGRRLFDDLGDKVPLKLVESTPLSTGVLHLRYAPADQ
jgi:dihydrofolate reductase